jgi:hypothetical protein
LTPRIPSLRAAKARVRAADALVEVALSSLYPTLDLNASATLFEGRFVRRLGRTPMSSYGCNSRRLLLKLCGNRPGSVLESTKTRADEPAAWHDIVSFQPKGDFPNE